MGMSLQSMGYLVGVYWPYLIAAGAVGLFAGWWAGALPKRRS